MKKVLKIGSFLFLVSVLTFAVVSCSKEDTVVKTDPIITWKNPADIISGTALSSTQLNAAANVAGTFHYSPPIGTILSEGPNQNLNVYFTPTVSDYYNTATKTVSINVTTSLRIGDPYQGGKIAYFFVSGDPGYVAGQTHGIVVSVSFQGTSNSWWNGINITTGATGSAIGTGSANTTAIIISQLNTGTYAAKLCRDYSGGGYNDWYLPSIDELNKLYINRDALGGFADNVCWSSTETDNNNASAFFFYSGTQSSHYKFNNFYVRAVRTF